VNTRARRPLRLSYAEVTIDGGRREVADKALAFVERFA
jgi:hypothetical protein